MTFYMGYNRARPKDIIPYAEANDVGLMTNAALRWSDRTDRFNQLWEYNCPHVVDSGGYNVLKNFGEYPWTIDEYHDWLTENAGEFDWAAVMDYACGKQFDELYSVEERQQRTFENTLKHFARDPDYPVLPVLQGRTVDQYVEFYDRLVDHGIPVDYVGLGTICRISNTKGVLNVEAEVRERCPKIDRLHGFGIKATAFKNGVQFETADSQVWVQAKTHGMKYVLEDEYTLKKVHESDPQTRTLESFKNYHEYATRLMEEALHGGPIGQLTFDDFDATAAD